MPFHIGLLLFPDITQLDMTGPHEVFIKFPDARVDLIWKTRELVTAVGGMQIMPTTTFADCPQLDLICVPGGTGMNALLNDAETLDFIRRQAKGARYVTSVCTGALVLGAAGLLQGRRAATHWMSREMLTAFGATPVAERVVIDGNVITGGGVTAGIDFALEVDNPNSVGLRLDQIDFNLFINNNRVLDSVSQQDLRIPANGRGDVNLRTRIGYQNVRSLWDEIVNVVRGNRAKYELRGNAYYDTPVGRLKFPVSVYSTQ